MISKLDEIKNNVGVPFESAIFPPCLFNNAVAAAAGTIAKPIKLTGRFWTSAKNKGVKKNSE